jgi:2,3-bisphosphoglycerate-independent phosphoglycerate mutase
LEAADIPNMDAVARDGRVGTVDTIPEGFPAGSDVAIMSVLGYAPQEYYSGRAPLEAASMGIELAPGDWAVRCNLVTITGGEMADYSAGHITPAESAEIVKALNAAIAGRGVEFHAGKGYRNLLVMRGMGELDVETTPPHDIAGRKADRHLPKGADARIFNELMEKSVPVLAGHPVNERRLREGKPPATSIWLWGQGKSAHFPLFSEVYGVRPAVITAVDLVAGICALAGWERIVVPGATGYYDTDYAGKGIAAAEALKGFDLVFVHVEAPDEAAHNRDAAAKVRVIEEIDRHVVGPLRKALAGFGPHRMLVMPDHYTLLSTAGHAGGAVPFAICGEGIPASGSGGFSERTARTGRKFTDGPALMGAFLGKANKWAS